MNDNRTESLLAASARIYANAGMAIFPVWGVRDGRCLCPVGDRTDDKGKPACTRGKHPRTPNGVLAATTDVARINAWWARNPDDNIGLAVGASGLAVLDVDPKNGGEESFDRLAAYAESKGVDLMDTLVQRTGSGGLHLVYTAPEGGIKNGANVFGPDMPGLDTRGRNGYIVAWPSIHACGGAYEWFDFFRDAAPWPDLLSVLMEPPKPKPAPRPAREFGTGDKAAYVAKAIQAECDELAVMGPDSGRNHRLNRAAFNLGQLVDRGLVSEREVQDHLLAAASACGLSQPEALKTIRSGLRGGARKPRTGLAA